EVLINSGSITAAADQMQLLDRVGQQDAHVVGGLRTQKARLAELKTQLEKDRARAAEAVQAREQEQARVESLPSQRQQVRDAASAAFPKVPSDQLEPGDLVFFNGLNHMGIYIGGGQYVHAPHTGDVVRVASLGDRSDYVGAVRP